MTTTLLATRNSLKLAVRRKIVNLLNPLVADLTDLHSRIKQAHWNLRGEAFYPLHRLLDEYSASVRGHIDEVAERATALGGIIDGTLSDAASKTALGGEEEPAS
jgi:starvation-inducible DNA-binding protein